MNFKLGEVCDIVADHGGKHPEIVGLECVIVEVYGPHKTVGREVWGWVGAVYERRGREFIFLPGELRPKKPPSEHVSTWGADVLGAPSPFIPKRERVT